MLLKIAELGLKELSQLGLVVDEFKKIGWVLERVPSSSHGKPMSNGAYLIIHPNSKKCYVGSHQNLYVRPYQHHSLLNLKDHWIDEFQEAYNLDPRIIPLFIITNTREEGYDIEQSILDKFYDTGLLFNIAKDARLALTGLEVSEDTRRKLSVVSKGRQQSPEHIERRAASLRGNVLSDETKNLIRIKAIERGVDPNMTLAASLVNSIPIIVDGKKYANKKEVRDEFNIAHKTVEKRIRSKEYPSWHFANDIYDRQVSIKGKIYSSIDEYSIKHNLNIDIIKLRIDSDNDLYTDWFYCDNQ